MILDAKSGQILSAFKKVKMKKVNSNSPPKWALRFFSWFCHPDFAEDIEGDLYEQFDRNLQEYGHKAAKWKFIWAVLTLFRPSLIRTFKITFLQNTTIMFGHNLKLSWRLLFKNKGFSLINIGGLAMGMAMAMFIVLWIKDELSFDGFHADKERIYKVMSNFYYSDSQIETFEMTNFNILETLRTEYPSVEKAVSVSYPRTLLMKKENNTFKAEGVYAGVDFFDIFSWNLLAGDRNALLTTPTSVVISATLAKKYFDIPSNEYQQIIGQTISHELEEFDDLIVTGVFDDVPTQSSLQFDYVLPTDFLLAQSPWIKNWGNNELKVFLKMKEGKDANTLSAALTNVQNQKVTTFRNDLFLYPLTSWYLNGTFKDGKLAGGRIEYIRVFALIALMIVLIACINFMNLSTARSIQRAKEIGVRKAIGAEKSRLVGQFMGESFLLILIAFILATLLIPFALPSFNTLTDKTLSLVNLDAATLLIFASIGGLTALIAGTYPAFYLSSFNAVKILKGTFQQSANSARFRKGLVVFQFAMSTLLIIGTITVYQQMQYIKNKNLGYERANILYMPLEGNMYQQYGVLHEELLKIPAIEAVSSANTVRMEIMASTQGVTWKGKAADNQQAMEILPIDFDFVEVMQMEIVKGRSFDHSFARDSFNYLINEKAAEVMGFDNPIGEELGFSGRKGAIIGVVKDFNSASLYDQINPIIMVARRDWNENVFLRTEPGKAAEAIAAMEKIQSKINPDYPFEYHFLDVSYDEMYKSEQSISQLSLLFTLFALFIAGMGLLGLSIFSVQRRLKEISIRKVLGAEIGNLVYLLSKDFIVLILIAFVVAAPIAFLVMQDWLSNFSFSTHLGVGVFGFAAGITLLITLLTVGFYAIKVAVINPIQALQSE